MSKYLFLSAIFLFAIHLLVGAVNQKRVLVRGGRMLFKNQKTKIESFEISKFEITNAQYAQFLNAKKVGRGGMLDRKQIINISSEDLQLEFINGVWKPKQGKENFPMVMVSYYGAKDFSNSVGFQVFFPIQKQRK